MDNSTAWQADYNQQHFEDLYFGSGKGVDSVKTYYEKQSSGRYSVDGEVSDWVKVPYNEARYGSNYCGDSTCPSVWNVVSDGLNAWVAQQKAAGRTDAQIKADVARFDEWDRYDFDGDGDFNEPDGYIDHFQIVHAGEDESAGGGVQGEDAIWAHRWYAFGTDAGATGPEENKLGGTQVGSTGIWVGDYTIQPENGGLGVFAHEYGHDLGLPDLYDTAGGENSTGFWTLMSSGSWLGTGKKEIGDLPGDMTAWDKLQLGWLNYDVAKAGVNSWHKLGVAEYNTKHKQALVVTLPKKAVTTEVVTPSEGRTQWWSGSGDDLRNTLSRTVDLTGKSSAELTFDGWYDIEANYDYLYTEVSTDGGANWTAIDGTVDGGQIPRDGSDKPALHGTIDGYKKFAYPGRVRRPEDRPALPLPDRRRRGPEGLHGRRDHGDGGRRRGVLGQRRDRRRRLEGHRLLPHRRVVHQRLRAVLHRREPAVRVVRQDPRGRPVQLRFHGPSGLGGALRVPERPADLEVGHLPAGQQHQRAPGQGSDPADRLPPDRAEVGGRHPDAQPHPGLRLPVQHVPHGRDHAAQGGRRQVHPGSKGVPVFNDRTNTYWDPANPTGSVQVTDTNTKIKITKEPKDGSTIELEVGPAGR